MCFGGLAPLHMRPKPCGCLAGITFTDITQFARVQVTSKRVANAKSERYHGNILKRGKVELNKVRGKVPLRHAAHLLMCIFPGCVIRASMC
jgi:hypothetical protein